MNQTLMDLRFALRRLRKNPGFSLIKVGILAIGLGATTALFGVVYGVLLEPLDYPEAERIYRLHEFKRQTGNQEDSISAPTYRDWHAGIKSFSALAAIHFDNYNLSGGREPQQIRVARVNQDFFTTFGPQPSAGRLFTPQENGSARERVVLLSEAVWQRQFGGADIRGAVLRFDGAPYTVIGVMPAGFNFPSWADVWMPLGEPSTEDRSRRDLRVYGLLKGSSNPQRAAAELAAMAGRLRTSYPATHEDIEIGMQPLLEEEVGEIRSTLWILFGAVAGVLLIVCLNVAGLELAQGLERRHELAVRSALGAGRRRVMQGLVIESLFLAALGGAIGVLLAQWTFDLILAFAPAGIPRLPEVHLDRPVLAFAVGITALSGLLSGWLPAYSSTRFGLAETLEIAPQGGERGGTKMRSALVVAQVALTVVLLSAAGLLLGSLQKMLAREPGFDADRMLSVGLVLPPNLYTEGHQLRNFAEEVQNHLEALPGVESATMANSLPWAGFPGRTLEVEALRATEDAPHFRGSVVEKVVSGNYFETLGVPLLQGRSFGSFDQAASSGGIERVVVNETFAHRAWSRLDHSPLGERLEIANSGQEPTVAEVVGVVADLSYGGSTEPAGPQIFRSYARQPWNYVNVAVRSAGGDPAELLAMVRQTVWNIDPNRPLFDEQTALGTLQRTLQRPRFAAFLFGTFAMVALVLAGLGIYGLMAFMVNRRRREIGIRMALGAHHWVVRSMILRQGMKLLGTGIVLGIPAALFATRLLEGLLFGVAPGEPWILGTVLMILTVVGWLATNVPAIRACRIEPMMALREE